MPRKPAARTGKRSGDDLTPDAKASKADDVAHNPAAEASSSADEARGLAEAAAATVAPASSGEPSGGDVSECALCRCQKRRVEWRCPECQLWLCASHAPRHLANDHADHHGAGLERVAGGGAPLAPAPVAAAAKQPAPAASKGAAPHAPAPAAAPKPASGKGGGGGGGAVVLTEEERQRLASKTGWDLRNAAQHGHLDEVRGILAVKPELVNFADVAGQSALHFAAYYGHVEVARELLRCGADINAQNWWGWTPLMNASWCGHTEVVRLLLEAGANKTLKHQDGDTALDYARNQKHAACIALLDGSALLDSLATTPGSFLCPSDGLTNRDINGLVREWLVNQPTPLQLDDDE